uniref:Uncharacterized protein n=1 Tax=Plectus sambesii TaxID=2011161 RepID=A0A914VUX7_9BILA
MTQKSEDARRRRRPTDRPTKDRACRWAFKNDPSNTTGSSPPPESLERRRTAVEHKYHDDDSPARSNCRNCGLRRRPRVAASRRLSILLWCQYRDRLSTTREGGRLARR